MKVLYNKNINHVAKNIYYEAKIIHCSDCGGTWYDDGYTASCPNCQIRELKIKLTKFRGDIGASEK